MPLRHPCRPGTLVERTTRLVVLVKFAHPLNPATVAHVLQAFSDKLKTIAAPMRKTLTCDRGSEMAGHLLEAAHMSTAMQGIHTITALLKRRELDYEGGDAGAPFGRMWP